MALWKRGFGGGDDAFTDLPSYADVQREVLGRGLRTVNLRLDLAPYPMVSFRIQPLRKGDGWTNDGYQLLRPNAKYIESLATIRTGDSVPIPFARECAAAPNSSPWRARRLRGRAARPRCGRRSREPRGIGFGTTRGQARSVYASSQAKPVAPHLTAPKPSSFARAAPERIACTPRVRMRITPRWE